MAGYATLAPALAGGPPGWVVWAIGGTVLTVGAIWAGKELFATEREVSLAPAMRRAIPRIRTCTDVSPAQECPKKKRYTVRVHAQGTDCGGKTSSTIGVPALTKLEVPVTVAEGLALSAGTWALLGARQQNVRFTAKAKADAYIGAGPTVGGRFGMKSFPADDRTGGKRYDVDVFGDGPSFLF